MNDENTLGNKDDLKHLI